MKGVATEYRVGNWREYLREYPVCMPAFEFDIQKTALLVVDMQRKIADRHATRGAGRMLWDKRPDLAEQYFVQVEEVTTPNIQKLLDFFRKNKLRVIYLTVGPELPSGDDMPFSFKLAYMKSHDSKSGGIYRGTPEFEIIEGIRPQPGELVLNKVSVGAFATTGLEHILRNMDIGTLVFVGGWTNACVETSTRDAADLGFRCVVVEDACVAALPLLHDATMINVSILFGRVLTTAEIISEMTQALEMATARKQ